MSTITRELAKLFRKITNSEIDAEGNAHVVLSPADSLLINNARIALASLEAEPVAWLLSGGGAKNNVSFDSGNAYADQLREVTPLYTAPPAPTAPLELGDLLSMAASAIEDLLEHTDPNTSYYSGVWADVPGKLRAAMLSSRNSEQLEPVSNRDELPATQFKPVADLYGITSPTGSETSFTFDAIEAANFIDGGWSVQEYVELERYQEAMIGNSPATPDGWIPVSERLPDDTVDADGGATCYLVLYAEGRQPNGGSNVQVSNVTYLRRWHEGMITHWMPLPESPMK